MPDPRSLVHIEVGEDRRAIALVHRPGAAPGLFWLAGLRSDMTGTKAETLDRFGASRGLAVTRFDYSGHGRSGGSFLDGTISRWLEEAVAVFERGTGPQIVVGSSMGGWIALLLARRLRELGDHRIKALVLIAPAVDMTEELMRDSFSAEEIERLEIVGAIERRSDYADETYPVTRALIEDGRRHLLFGAPIETGCPVAILQGGKDRDVPQAQALKLVSHLLFDPVTLTLVPDGDHRLSRPEDIARLEAALERAIAG